MWKSTERIPTFPQLTRITELDSHSRFIEVAEARRRTDENAMRIVG